MPMWIIWLLLCGLFFIIEIFTISFLMFWPGVAAFIAFILASIGVNTSIQIVVFCILSIILIVCTKPLTNKFFKVKDTATNVKSVIGKKGIVLKLIDNINCKGQVKVAGEVWSAMSESDEIIPVDCQVEVVSVEGVKVRVKKI